MTRREFFKFLYLATSYSLALSCKKGKEVLIPYVVPPDEEIRPGKLIYYNTTCTACPANCGVSARVEEKVWNGRRRIFPVKLEGNPSHPINEGKLCSTGQSWLNLLYSFPPEEKKRDLFDRIFLKVFGIKDWQPPLFKSRLTKPLLKEKNGSFKEISWEEAYKKIIEALKEAKRKGFKNYFLSCRTTGSISKLMEKFCQNEEIIRVPEFEPNLNFTLMEANDILFGRKEIPFYKIEEADLLITMGADLVETFVSPVNYSIQISKAKRNGSFKWIHFEPHLSMTGISAHRRFTISPKSESILLSYLIKKIYPKSEFSSPLPEISEEKVSEFTSLNKDILELLFKEISSSKKVLFLPGGISLKNEDGLKTGVLAGLLTYFMGGKSLLDFGRRENYQNVGTAKEILKFQEILKEEKNGLIFFFNLDPSDFFEENLLTQSNCILKVGAGEFLNETFKDCDLVLPLSDTLEVWGDAEPRGGIINLIQPTTEPFFDTLSQGDLILNLIEKINGKREFSSYQEYLLINWKNRGGNDFVKTLIKDGFVAEENVVIEPTLKKEKILDFVSKIKMEESKGDFFLLLTPSIRTKGNKNYNELPLFLEVPDPITTVTYGQWAGISPQIAEEKNLKNGDEINIILEEKSYKIPVVIIPSFKRNIVMINQDLLKNFKLMKFNASGDILSIYNIEGLNKTGLRVSLPILSGSFFQDKRGIVKDFEEEKHLKSNEFKSFYPKLEHKEYRWAMVIDLELCTGCSACVAACYIENNIPIVGKELHLQGRELSWIRLEPFYDDKERPSIIPMLCQQCCCAPCESVCPVYATYHNPEGLNAQIYNRCVGTRYCSNNCPYKVRRFNWFDFSKEGIQSFKNNPDVSLRTRGVMEKCTFCVHRIRRAKEEAKDKASPLKDGDVIPACAQTCPTGAIFFGNILDKNSIVYKLANSERAYRILEHLGTEPAIYYLKKEEKIK